MPRLVPLLLGFTLFSCARPDAAETPFVLADGVFESAAEILESGERFELLALEPMPLEKPTPEAFCGYEVRGRAPVDPATGRAALRLVQEGILASDGSVAACFNPRHGIRVESPAGTCDLVICYECLSMQVFVDGAHAENVLTSEEVEPRISMLWLRLGLILAPD